MMYIHVYKTDVESREDEARITAVLTDEFTEPDYEISFDLEDCDNVFRIESLNGKIDEDKIFKIFKRNGFSLEKMPTEG
jgi:hypothetical protein